MAEKIFTNVRLGLKIDTLENWGKSSLVLKKGEVAFATVAASAGTGLTEPVCMMKIGDGDHTFSELDFNFYAKSSDVLAACKSEDTLKTFINGVIADAGIASSDAMEALAGRVGTAEGKITTLEGKMTAVEGKVSANETAIAALGELVGDTEVAVQIQNAINELDLANTYEAKGEAAKVQTALNEYKTSNDAAVQKNASDIASEISRAKAAEEANAGAISAIKDGTTIDSFKDVEEALAGKQATGDYATKAEAQAMADAKDSAIAEAKKAGTDAAAAAAKAQGDVDKVSGLVGETEVSVQISTAINDLKLEETYAAKAHTHTKSEITDFAHNHEMGEVNGLVDALAGKQAKGDYATKAEAQGYANAKDEAIEAAQAAADAAQADVDALETYVGTIPADYTESNVIAFIQKRAQEVLDAASGGSSESAASVLAALNTYKAENDPKVQANTDAIAALEALVGEDNVAEAIAAAVEAEKERAEGIEGGLNTRLAAVEGDYLKAADKEALQTQINTIMNNPDAEGAINSINEFTQYVTEHGTIAKGMQDAIDANADAIEAVEGRMADAEADIEALEGAVATKAAQTDLDAVSGRVTTVEGKVSTLETEMDAVEGRATALENLVGEDKVADQISEAIEALKIGDYAKASALAEAIAQHNTDKAALEASIAKKADDSALAAIAKTGSTDDLVQGEMVLVFDCGTSAE